MSDSFEKIALRQSIIREQWLPLDAAIQEAVIFEKRFGPGHFLLACHAALPSQLTPELLHFIRLNFLDQREPPVPWIAEMDFLLSPLCRAVGEDLYEVEPAVREALLDQLEEHYGWQRLQEIAHFLLEYLRKTQESKRNPGVAQLHEWIAQSYLQPVSMLDELRRFLLESIDTQQAPHQTLAKRIRFARTIELLAEPLARHTSQKDYYDLIHSARALAYVLYGNQEKLATTTLSIQPSSEQSTSLFPPEIQQWLNTKAIPQPESEILLTSGQAIPQAPQSKGERISAEHEETPVEKLLRQAGWLLQNYEDMNPGMGQGIAVRSHPSAPEDYLLVVDGELAGIVHIRPVGEPLAGTEESVPLSRLLEYERNQFFLRKPARHILPFVYEATGYETRFTNYLEPDARSRDVFTFHRPKTLALWLDQAPTHVPVEKNGLLRSRLRRMPPLQAKNLNRTQLEAIRSLEQALANNNPHPLVRIATGTGKSHMLISSIYRLLEFGGARRILYLTDRQDIARDIYNAFERSVSSDDNNKFIQSYHVQLLRDKVLGPTTNVCVSSIQELYLSLQGKSFQNLSLEQHDIDLTDIENILSDKDNELEDTKETEENGETNETLREEKGFLEENESDLNISEDNWEKLVLDDFEKSLKLEEPIRYNPVLPIEIFDIIILDNGRSNLYNRWRPVLDYFDAFIIDVVSSKIFISYSHRDAEFLNELQKHLLVYERPEQISIWDDTKIFPGANWRDEIKKALESARIAILLVSADFLASSFIQNVELPLLLEAENQEELIILSIIVRPCLFKATPLVRYQTVNPPSQPLSSLSRSKREEMWARLVNSIEDLL